MFVAHGLGFAVRAIGRGARDLDPLHRRDGIGLAILGAAIVTAATTWWHLGNEAGRVLWAVVSGAFGSAAWSVPLLLALLSWRFLRHPERNAETGRMLIGWSALIAGALGLVHIANGTPPPTAGAAVMRSAGGFIGFFVSAPLVAAVTPWVAAPLLALLCGFGLLVITATPVHRIPERLADLHGFVRGDQRDPGAAGDAKHENPDPHVGAGAKKGARSGAGHLLRGTRARKAAIEPGDHEKPYDTPLLSGPGVGQGHPSAGNAAARGAASLPGGSQANELGEGVGRPGAVLAGPASAAPVSTGPVTAQRTTTVPMTCSGRSGSGRGLPTALDRMAPTAAPPTRPALPSAGPSSSRWPDLRTAATRSRPPRCCARGPHRRCAPAPIAQ